LRETIQRYLQAGRHRAFRRFWLGMLISRAGDAFTAVALSWVVLGIAGPAQLGIVLACFGLPRVVSGPVAGRVLDRRNPRLLLAADNAARGILIAIVPVLLWLHHLVVAELYAIAAASALCSALTEVAEASLVPRMVDDEHLEGANTLLAANWEVAGVAGPAISGLIIASLGTGYALVLDAASFAVMSAICLRLPAFRPVRTVEPGSRSVRRHGGLGILLRYPAAAVLTVCSVGLLALDGMTTVLYPVYCRTFLHVSAVGYGVLVSVSCVGALLGIIAAPVLFGRLPLGWRIGGAICVSAPVFGLLRLALDLPVAAGLLGLATFCSAPYFAFDRTFMQRLVPGDVLGRLAGARMTVSSLGFPLGSAIGGALIGVAGVPAMILVIAAVFLVLGALPPIAWTLSSDPGARPVIPAGQNAE
jgi:MFS family permease